MTEKAGSGMTISEIINRKRREIRIKDIIISRIVGILNVQSYLRYPIGRHRYALLLHMVPALRERKKGKRKKWKHEK